MYKRQPLKVKHPSREDDVTSIWFVSMFSSRAHGLSLWTLISWVSLSLPHMMLSCTWTHWSPSHWGMPVVTGHSWCLGDAGFLRTKPMLQWAVIRCQFTRNEYQTKLAFWALFQVSYNQSTRKSTIRFKRFSGLELLLTRDAWVHLITLYSNSGFTINVHRHHHDTKSVLFANFMKPRHRTSTITLNQFSV